MGKHSKPSTHSATGPLVAVAIATSVPLTQGVAHADSGDVDWTSVIHCESGGNPHAVNRSSTASGLFQFLDSTWRGLGGAAFGSRARDATPEQQTEIANRAYARSGLTPWEASRSCWRSRIGRTTPQTTRTIRFALPRRAQGRHALAPRITTAARYTVRGGDSLSSIAAAHGHTWEQLFALNKATIKNPSLIHVGLTINL